VYAFSRILSAIGVASLVAACSSASGTGPVPQNGAGLTPQSVAQTQSVAKTAASVAQTASAARTIASDHKKNDSDLTATPASLEFASGATAAQSVVVNSKRDDQGTYDVSIAGTGNCPTVSPSTLLLKNHSMHGHGDDAGGGDGDHDDGNAGSSTITVTPNGAGPATCTITVAKHDKDAVKDAAQGKSDGDDESLTIPVTVDAPVATPTPTASPTPTATPTPAPTDTPAPTPSPTPGR
jgi:hypothetical protein